MAFLIPLLLPHIVEAGANLGIGISNAIQGDHSSVSFQIGSKVFSSRKSFNFGSLPPELRVRILLEALHESVSYIQPTPFMMDPLSARMYEIQRQVPLHPEHQNYRAIFGDRVSANGYPISSWRWQGVCSEWREELKAGLWRDLEVVGFRPWSNLIEMIESKKGASDILKLVKTVTMREGFNSTSDLYAILSCPALNSLESIAILPDYPTPYHPLVPPIPAFTFGFQLIRTQKDRLKSLTYGLPLESTTNEASRQNLARLRPAKLTLSFVRPSIALFKELEGLVAETTKVFEIRYIPGGSGRIALPSVFLCDPLQAFKKIVLYLYLPRTKVEVPGPFGTSTYIPQGDQPAVSEFIASLVSALEVEPQEVKDRYEIWRVENWEMAGMVHKATKARLWPEMSDEEALEEEMDVASGSEEKRRFSVVGGQDKVRRPSMPMDARRGSMQEGERKERKHWDRETNLKLLGGLVNLRLESKKH